MKILILLCSLIFSLTTLATEADTLAVPGCPACKAMQDNGAKLSNKKGVCITRGCGMKSTTKKVKGSGTAPVSN